MSRYVAMRRFASHYVALRRITLHYIVLCHVTMHCITLRHLIEQHRAIKNRLLNSYYKLEVVFTLGFHLKF